MARFSSAALQAIIVEAQAWYQTGEHYYERSGWPCPGDVDRWTDRNITNEVHLFDELAARLAVSYHSGVLSYDFCDHVCNGIWGHLIERQLRIEPQPAMPQLFYRVFTAFDAGEFHRKDDKSDDPVAEFTDPAIAEIVASLDV